MANGMGSLYIGASGLQNSQNALNTTANNLANADTKGYVRQQVLFADRDYVTFKGAAIMKRIIWQFKMWRICFRSWKASSFSRHWRIFGILLKN